MLTDAQAALPVDMLDPERQAPLGLLALDREAPAQREGGAGRDGVWSHTAIMA